jgi:hypothetical protein
VRGEARNWGQAKSCQAFGSRENRQKTAVRLSALSPVPPTPLCLQRGETALLAFFFFFWFGIIFMRVLLAPSLGGGSVGGGC